MDNRFNNTSKVKPLFSYLKEAIKFYDIKNPLVAQIVFIVELIIVFGGNFLAKPYAEEFLKTVEQTSVKLLEQYETNKLDISLFNSDIFASMQDSIYTVLMIMFAINALSLIVSLFYGTYYYFSLTNTTMKASDSALIFFKRLPKLIIFNILFYGIFFIFMLIVMMIFGIATVFVQIFGIFLSLIPIAVLFINTLYIFKDFLIIEFDIGILKNFKMAPQITKGSRRHVIINGLWPLVTGWLLSTLAIDVNNQILSLFIAAFLQVIIQLVYQRMAVLMFIDIATLKRQDKKTEQSILDNNSDV